MSQKRKQSSSSSSAYYVNNRDFTDAICDYIIAIREADEISDERPQVTNYIADCFLKISNGLARRWNFAGYTYREEMVMDGVENCLRYITRFNIDRAERKKLNAFAYFTQICYYAFVRRINKEAKQQEIKLKVQQNFTVDDYIEQANQLTGDTYNVIEQQINQIKSKAEIAFEK